MTTGINYRLAVPEDYDSVLEFLREHYYPEEPLTIACEPLEQDVYDEQANMSNIRNQPKTCIVATCGDQVVGTVLCGQKGRDEEKKLIVEASHIPGTKWGKLLLFLAVLDRDSKVYEKYNIDKAIHGHVMAVHKMFRGRGIGLQLFAKSIERAKELGYPLYTTDCTSVYSARLCERLGMDCVNVYSFAEYRASGSDEQVLFPPGEHKLVKTFAKRL